MKTNLHLLKPDRMDLWIAAGLLLISAAGCPWTIWSVLCWLCGMFGVAVIGWFCGIHAAQFEVRRMEEENKTLLYLLEKEREMGSRDMASDLNARHAHGRNSNN